MEADPIHLVFRCQVVAATRGGVADELADPDRVASIDNPKGELQEQLQGRNGGSPTYELLGSSGPAHAREFEVAVHHAGRELGRGSGGSKKEAESRAATAALAKLRDA